MNSSQLAPSDWLATFPLVPHQAFLADMPAYLNDPLPFRIPQYSSFFELSIIEVNLIPITLPQTFMLLPMLL